MCLSVVSERKPKPSGVGYKVFIPYGNRLRGLVYGGIYVRGAWRKAKGDPSVSDHGFHIYKKKTDAEARAADHGFNRIVVRVRYRGAITRVREMADLTETQKLW